MKVPFCVLGLLGWGSLQGCSPRQDSRPASAIRQVSFAMGGCVDSCHYMALQVDSQLTYRYYCLDTSRDWFGKVRSAQQGYFTGHVTPAFWDTLVTQLARARYEQRDTGFHEPNLYGAIRHIPTELIVHAGSRRFRFYGTLPSHLWEVQTWLRTSPQVVELRPSRDTLAFDTRYQYDHLVEPPPIPELK